MKKWLWLLLCLIWSAPAAWGAAQLKSLDFAFGLSLPVPPGASVMALHLPQHIYRQVVRTDLGDMRVFNAADEPVPQMPNKPGDRAAADFFIGCTLTAPT